MTCTECGAATAIVCSCTLCAHHCARLCDKDCAPVESWCATPLPPQPTIVTPRERRDLCVM